MIREAAAAGEGGPGGPPIDLAASWLPPEPPMPRRDGSAGGKPRRLWRGGSCAVVKSAEATLSPRGGPFGGGGVSGEQTPPRRAGGGAEEGTTPTAPTACPMGAAARSTRSSRSRRWRATDPRMRLGRLGGGHAVGRRQGRRIGK